MQLSKRQILQEIESIAQAGSEFFARCFAEMPDEEDQWYYTDKDYFWNMLSDEVKCLESELRNDIIRTNQNAMELCRGSMLPNDADYFEIKIATKRLLALLRLREYHYSGPEAIHDEGVVLGFQPSYQYLGDPKRPAAASKDFQKQCDDLRQIIALADDKTGLSEKSTSSGLSRNEFRPNTAFIMMWMDGTNPELEDVRDAVAEVFRSFAIVAVRADDIEHEGVISQKVIDEIRTSEFLFADLTGGRPNVYYEVGFAHALRKRVILFRKSGTDIHFDLAGYNCPEYENLRDLKAKLTKRLEYVTNKAQARDET